MVFYYNDAIRVMQLEIDKTENVSYFDVECEK